MVFCMAIMARETWTDERLDDLKENLNQRFDRVDKRFEQVDQRFDRVEAEMKAGFAEVNGRVDQRFDFLEVRIDALSRTIIICFSGMTASIVAALLLTQL
jgi:chaperonin cofactor prefoldin